MDTVMVFQSYTLRKQLASRTDKEPDVFAYDEIDDFLRHQICMAFSDGIGCFFEYGHYSVHSVNEANHQWGEIFHLCLKEIHSFVIYTENNYENEQEKFLGFIKSAKNVDDLLSAIEIGALGLLITGDSLPSPRSSPFTLINES